MRQSMTDEPYKLIQGDCLEVLRGMGDCSIDAVVTDPPYDLTSKDKRDYRRGYPHREESGEWSARKRKGFMGKDWDGTGIAFRVELWEEVLRVLKPGGHLVAMGGSRTYHRLVCAIEDAGFEIRDCITWHYGSGFPKSLDVSKAIDKAAGAERDVVGKYIAPRQRERGTYRDEWPSGEYDYTQAHTSTPNAPAITRKSITAPATSEAAQWEGWGTALKPASEYICLARKPLEGTVASNVQEWGTGALNIDGCRVSTTDNLNGGAYAKNGTPRNDGWGMQRAGAGTYESPAGRWPSNLVLTHSAACRQVGERRIKVQSGPASGPTFGKMGTQGIYGSANGGADLQPKYHADPDGMETVAAWECAEDCPVRALDEQSGERPSGNGNKSTRRQYDNGVFGKGLGYSTNPSIGGDTGGASRFYPTFAWEPEYDVPFLYCAKAARSERNEGLEDREPTVTNDGRPTLIDNPYQRGETLRQNSHPCVKPIALMGWLARLITPPNGLILDPFTGSGTTGVAALLEGFRFVGIEKEPEYMEIAQARLTHAAHKPVQLRMEAIA